VRADDDLRQMRLDAHTVTDDSDVRRLPAALSSCRVLDELLVAMRARAYRSFFHYKTAAIAIEPRHTRLVQVHEKQRLVMLGTEVSRPVPDGGRLAERVLQLVFGGPISWTA
jgi:hypothetical protein